MAHKKTSNTSEVASQEWVQTQNVTTTGIILNDILGDGELAGGTVTCNKTVVLGSLSAIGAVENDTTGVDTGLVAIDGVSNIRFVLDTLKTQDIAKVVLRDYKTGGGHNKDGSAKEFKLYASSGMPTLTFGDLTNLTHISDNTLLQKNVNILDVQEFVIDKTCRFIVIDVVNNYGETYTGLRTFNARLKATKEYTSTVEAAANADEY
ncbi:MAG: hypothetical protein GY928_19125, partial [Colwellia sp.]|nr:hypothetical protein [Colwellia sp.]